MSWTDQERLQALLADEPLTQVPPSAEVASSPSKNDGDAAQRLAFTAT